MQELRRLANNPGHMSLVGVVGLRMQHDGQDRSDWIDSALEPASALQIAADLLILSLSRAGWWLGGHWRSELEELFSAVSAACIKHLLPGIQFRNPL